MVLMTFARLGRHFHCLLRVTACGFFLQTILTVYGSEWHSENGYRWADLNVPKGGKPGFTLLPADTTGLFFTNILDEATGAAHRVLFGGAGVAVGDFDGDGLPDIFLCNLSGSNALFKNLGG